MGYMLISTKRLVIKEISIADAPRVFEYRQAPEVLRFQSFNPKSIDEVHSFIRNEAMDFNKENTWLQLGIYLAGQLIGDMGIHFIGPENKQCEIGYTIDPKYQKNGYGKESVSGVLDYLFRELDKHRIIASLDPENEASRNLLESLGFRNEGCFKKSILNKGEWGDDLVYALLDEEWIYGASR
jgi:RimJ/RimL family protein N-acetyltransferase